MSYAPGTHYMLQVCSQVVRQYAKDHEGILRIEVTRAPNDNSAPYVIGAGQCYIPPQLILKCTKCDEIGHLRKDCPTPDLNTVCHNCHEIGHQVKDCNQPLPSCDICGGRKHSDPSNCRGPCFNCHKPGHQKADCTERPRKRKRGCFNCGKPGHKMTECSLPAKDDDKPAQPFDFPDKNAQATSTEPAEDSQGKVKSSQPAEDSQAKSSQPAEDSQAKSSQPAEDSQAKSSQPAEDSQAKSSQPAEDSQAKSSQPAEDSQAKSSQPAEDSQAKSSQPAEDSQAKSSQPAEDSQAKSSQPAEDSQAKSSQPAEDSQAKSSQPAEDSQAKSTEPAGEDNNTGLDEDETEDVAPATNTFQEYAPGDYLHAILETHVGEGNVTALQIRLRGTYTDSSQKTGRSNSIAIGRFTAKNIQGAVDCNIVAPNDEELVRLVTGDALHNIQTQAAIKTESLLYHIRFTVQRERQIGTYGNANNLGVALFSDRTHGPFTAAVHQIRQMLMDQDKVTIHFFTFASTEMSFRMEGLQSAMEKELIDDPWSAWWADGKMKVQLGQQLAAEDRPVHSVPRCLQFDSDTAWLTTHFYGTVGELEAVRSVGWVETSIIVVQYTHTKKSLPPSYFAIVHMAPGLDCAPCSLLQVRFLGPEAEEANDWSGMVLPKTPWGSSYTYELFIRRPLHDNEFIPKPDFDAEHILKASDFANVSDLAAAVKKHRGIRIWARATLPRSSLERELNTLRIAHRGGNAYDLEKAIIRGNTPNALPTIDFFQPHIEKYGASKVQTSQDFAITYCHLNEEQKNMFKGMRSMKGGIWLADGPPGVGKTRLIDALAIYGYVLTRDQPNTEPGFGMWFLSPMNAHLNGVMMRIHEELIRLWEKSRAEGHTYRYPVTPREHAHATDTALYRRHAMQARQDVGVEIDRYADHEANCRAQDSTIDGEVDPQLLSDMQQDYVLRRWYTTFNGSARTDRRTISDTSLAHGQMMLDLAGVRTADGTAHPMSEGYVGRFANFRRLLEDFGQGVAMDEDKKKELAREARDLRDALNERSDVRGLTYHILSHPRSHSGTPPSIVCHDEAGKTPETQTLHALFLARTYTEGPGGLHVDSNQPPVPHLFCGDLNQPRPVTGPNTERPFHDQKGVTLFARLLCGGFDSTKFTMQYRSVDDICDLVNAVMVQEELTTHPSVYDRPHAAKSRQFIKRFFGKDSAFVFASLSGDTGKHAQNDSAYNLKSARLVIGLVQLAIKHRYLEGKDIGIATPYVAQRDVYLTAKQGLVEDFKAQGMESLAQEATDISVFTVDSMQGLQCAFVFFDPVITTEMGFVSDRARWLLAVSRPQSGLIIVCAEGQLEAAHTADKSKTGQWHRSPIYATIAHAKQKRVFVNLDASKWSARVEKMLASFELGVDLRLRRELGSIPMAPYDYSETPEDDDIPPDMRHSMYEIEEFCDVQGHPHVDSTEYRELLPIVRETIFFPHQPITPEEHLKSFEADPGFQELKRSDYRTWSACRQMITNHGLDGGLADRLLSVAERDPIKARKVLDILLLYGELSDDFTRLRADNYRSAQAALTYKDYVNAVESSPYPRKQLQSLITQVEQGLAENEKSSDKKDNETAAGDSGAADNAWGNGKNDGADNAWGNGKNNGADNGWGNGKNNGADNGWGNGKNNGADNAWGNGNGNGNGADNAWGNGNGNGNGADNAWGNGNGNGADNAWGNGNGNGNGENNAWDEGDGCPAGNW
ncbi:hypothetical protein J1614_012175 [Plenodomus biglobosus]|nr:hypothetical protein J1614_012175 [Plenodomus biglobosus]